jgi:hypothetical protein
VAAGSEIELARKRGECFWPDPDIGNVVLNYDDRIARTLAKRSPDSGLRNIPFQYGKVLDLTIGLQDKELSNVDHPHPQSSAVRALGPQGGRF